MTVLTHSLCRSNSFSECISSVLPFVLGLVSFTVFCIVSDSVYYGTLTLTINGAPFRDANHFIVTLFNPMTLASVRSEGDIVITPLNNLLYNLNVDNLAQHGLHPRYTHFVINLPLLFGPLALFALLYLPSAFEKITNETNADLFYGKKDTIVLLFIAKV